ncbi:MAG TPA: hypothetical protein PK199_07540 [Bacteroidales bacterium]|nr:hypothetical protein [Bacteroidales bacterium]
MKYTIHQITVIIFTLVFASTSCKISSTIPSAPLLEEQGQTVVDVGVFGVLPGLQTSVAYAISPLVAVQTEFACNEDSYHIQQAIGLYKKQSSIYNYELYAGYLYGKYDADSWFGFYSENGDYSVYFARINFATRWHPNSKWLHGMSMMPGYICNPYCYLDTYYENNQFTSEYVYGLQTGFFYAHQLFVKFDLPRVRIGGQAQVIGGYNYRVKKMGIDNINFGLSFQYKKCSNPELCPRLFKQKEKYTHSSYFKVSVGTPLVSWRENISEQSSDKISVSIDFIPTSVSYNYQLFNWLNVSAGLYHYAIQGSDYKGSKFRYSDTKLLGRAYYNFILTKTFDVYMGTYFAQPYYSFSFIQNNDSRYEFHEEHLPMLEYGLIPIGVGYYFKNKFGLHIETTFRDWHASVSGGVQVRL